MRHLNHGPHVLQRRVAGYDAARSQQKTTAGSGLIDATLSRVAHHLGCALKQFSDRVHIADDGHPVADALFGHTQIDGMVDFDQVGSGVGVEVEYLGAVAADVQQLASTPWSAQASNTFFK